MLSIAKMPLCLLFTGTLLIAGCADHLERKDVTNSYSGDSVARNIAIHTINPTPRRARYRHLHHDGARMVRAIDRYQKPPEPRATKDVAAPKISDF